MPWEKGQSGNPGGRAKADPVLAAAAKELTMDALGVLEKIMKSDESPASSRVTAACAILDRGHGKPAQMVDLGDETIEKLQEIEPMELARRVAFVLTEGTDSRIEH